MVATGVNRFRVPLRVTSAIVIMTRAGGIKRVMSDAHHHGIVSVDQAIVRTLARPRGLDPVPSHILALALAPDLVHRSIQENAAAVDTVARDRDRLPSRDPALHAADPPILVIALDQRITTARLVPVMTSIVVTAETTAITITPSNRANRAMVLVGLRDGSQSKHPAQQNDATALQILYCWIRS
uniref:Uncharacterized protein n=1 Tax=Globisporangium ultimum (strain ATCC 200006 / CBS 805.95 / DAOM BR144) TaxID=431595 RepID=K3WBS0_GLOUD